LVKDGEQSDIVGGSDAPGGGLERKNNLAGCPSENREWKKTWEVVRSSDMDGKREVKNGCNRGGPGKMNS